MIIIFAIFVRGIYTGADVDTATLDQAVRADQLGELGWSTCSSSSGGASPSSCDAAAEPSDVVTGCRAEVSAAPTASAHGETRRRPRWCRQPW